MTRRTNQKFQMYDLVQLDERIPWIRCGGKAVSHRAGSGKQAIVIGSYYDQYGGGARERTTFSLLFEDFGESSWYDEEDMTLIEEMRVDLFEKWKGGDADDD